MNVDFWRGKRVFVTGHTGFKGSWLCFWLGEMGAEVTGYALPATNPGLFNDLRLETRMCSRIGDIRDLAALGKVLAAAKPDIVIHMAAQALVRKSYDEPLDTYTVNVIGTVNLLEATRHVSSIRAVVAVTSDKCYENREWAWGYRENEAMGGYDPYSSSKGCAELVTAAYRNSFFHPARHAEHGVAIASARAGNVIGGGDWSTDRIVPDIMRALITGKDARIRNPASIRPWQHVLEPLRGYLMLAERLYNGETAFAQGWNFGPREDDAKPVGWLVQRLTDLWGNGAGWTIEGHQQAHPHEAHYLKLDCSLAAMQLNWSPRWNLDRALESIVAWYKIHATGADIVAETSAQIRSYAGIGSSSTAEASEQLAMI